jgi:hypothetical protein
MVARAIVQKEKKEINRNPGGSDEKKKSMLLGFIKKR